MYGGTERHDEARNAFRHPVLDGLLKGEGLKSKSIQLFRVQCFGNRNEFDNFDKLLQLGNSNRIDRKKSQHILICWDIFLSN